MDITMPVPLAVQKATPSPSPELTMCGPDEGRQSGWIRRLRLFSVYRSHRPQMKIFAGNQVMNTGGPFQDFKSMCRC